ncbi:FkbM family methyltransferase [Pontibacter aydingkolensis]|uniref:FkbM family methyltransferase n=1 Tax=Pontibacter aydingkolensis TaxID=1911536 RepID=A0ABS7CTN8_9BACT|nr:FkbM family methyltransferase [Pontibacter aydingkolensis]MBW7467207.1 FkbM family methyltransferase [Pontibacter aydingkolensis]
MYSSLRILLSSPYNKKHPIFAIKRFITWKFIRAARLKDIKVNFWGDRVFLINYDSFQSMWLMYNYIVDWEEFNLIKAYVRPHDQIVDIGTNMGFYSIWMSKFLTSGNVHSFEPDHMNYNRLIKNIELNSLNDVIIANNTALSNLSGLMNFTIGLDGENHIAQSEESESILVETLTLDSYADKNNLSNFSYVKIDVEGFEKDVLEGARNLLAHQRIDIIQLEINDSLKNSGTSVVELLEQLQNYNYILCNYNFTSNSVHPIEYSASRENYFAVNNINSVNRRLLENANKCNPLY